MAWSFVTPEGDRSPPFASQAEATVELVVFCARRTFAKCGVFAEPKRLPFAEAEPLARELQAQGWTVERAR